MRKRNPADNGVHLPFDDIDFINAWQEWLAYRSERRLPKYVPRGLKQTFTKLKNDCENDAKKAVEMIFYAMSKNWQGLYPIKANYNGTGAQTQQTVKASATRESVNEAYNKRFGQGG